MAKIIKEYGEYRDKSLVHEHYAWFCHRYKRYFGRRDIGSPPKNCRFAIKHYDEGEAIDYGANCGGYYSGGVSPSWDFNCPTTCAKKAEQM